MIYAELIGGLGNQMFVYAFARALSLRTGEPAVILDGKGESRHLFDNRLPQLNISPEVTFLEGSGQAKQRCFWQSRVRALVIKWEQRQGMTKRDWSGFEAAIEPALNRLGVHFSTEGYAPCRKYRWPRDLLAYGYFQSEDYFADYAGVISEELKYKGELSPECRAWAERIDSCAAPVALHVRRGDFFDRPENAFLRVCTPAYYRRAIERMRQEHPDATLFLFSDDPGWAAANIDPAGLPAHVIPAGHRTVEDLTLMQHCRHFIISNSTYSWWGQYLCGNPSRTVLAPERWYANEKTTALYQPFWIKIPVEEEESL